MDTLMTKREMFAKQEPLVVSEVEIFCEKARTAFSTVKF
jgi:hypothetical protein